MAIPTVDKCIVVLLLVLVLYTGNAFRIRDAVQSTGTVEKVRSNVCGSSTLGKCTGDVPRTDSSSTLVPLAKKRFKTVGPDVARAGVVSKPKETSVEADTSEEVIQYSGKTSSVSSFSKIRTQEAKIKLQRSVVVEKSDEDDDDEGVVIEDDDDDDEEVSDEDDVEEIDADDEDDDGVEISTSEGSEEEGSEVVIDDSKNEDDDDDDEDGDGVVDDDDDDDDDDNDDDDDDGNEDEDDDEEDVSQSEEEKKVDSKSKVKVIKKESKQESDDDEEGDDDDDTSQSEKEKKVDVKSKTKTAKKDRKQELDDDEEGDDDDASQSKEQKKINLKSKVKVVKKDRKQEHDDDGDEGEDDDDASQSEEQTKDDKKSKVKVVKKDGKQESSADGDDDKDENIDSEDEDDEDDEDDDDDDDGEDEDDDDEEEIIPAKVTPPVRKLEKVRLADKDKVRSVEIPQTTKPKSVIVEKPIQTKENTTKIEKTTKTKDVVEKVTKDKKIDTVAKPEVVVKVKESSSKVSVKSETPKSTTKETSKPEATKIEVPKTTKKAEVTKAAKDSEKPKAKPKSEDKTSTKKKSVSSQPSSKNQSKSTTAKRTDASISLTDLNEAIHWVPTFMPNFTVVEDPVCQQHGKIFLRQLRGHKLWALQMLDASAKIPSGLLRGNINQLGDFDECLGITARVKVDEKTVKIQGKYCLATLDLHASIPDMRVPVNLIQSRGFIRASMRDPGHFIPRFTTAKWALCIPAACSAEDARIALESGLRHLNVSSGMRFNVNVEPDMCYVRQKGYTYSKETIAVIYFYAMITCVVLIATARDYLISPQGKGNFSERIIMAFSLRRTLGILTREGRSDAGDISCINGIRSLATIALYVAHKIIPIAQIPYANRIALTEVANNPISSVLRASLAYTDCFLLLSGLLTAFNMAKERSNRGEIRWFCRFVARFIRLTPALLVTLFWYAYVMEHTGSGPQWNSVIATNAELCKQNSWTNFLYIQNFFPFEEMCATHTHQLALDMQLSLLAPVLVFFLTFKPIIGILLVFLLLQIAATLRYFATTNNYLSLVIFHGMSLKHLYKTANLTYALPLHRASPYIFGVALGALLHYTGKNIRIYKIFVILGWLIAAALGSWSLFSPWRMASRDYTYNVEDAAQYAVIAPVSWSLALCWIIFACYTNHGGFINKFLSHYWMILFSRISYAVYLCQFAIFFYNVGTARYSSDFQIHRLVDPYEAAVVIFVAVILTLFVDIPMQELKNVIMECTDTPVIPISNGEESMEPKDEKIAGQTNVLSEDADKEEEIGETESERPEWDWTERSESRMSVEEDGLVERRRRSQSSQRVLIPEPDNRVHDLSSYQYHQEEFRRDRRSTSRQSDRNLRHEELSYVPLRKERPTSRASEPKTLYPEMEDPDRTPSRYDYRGRSFEQEQNRSQSCEPVRHERPRHPSVTRREPPRLLSSGSEDEEIQYQQQQHHHHHKPSKVIRRQPSEPKVSDEEDWEQELRIRRRRFMERLASENRSNERADEGNDGWDGVTRRSSAEGKLALLQDAPESNVMDSWTVSRGSRVLQPGSSQETEDESADLESHEYYQDRRGTLKDDYRSEEESSADQSRRRSYAGDSQVTSLEDEEDVENNDFVLKKESKKVSVMDLSKLSQEESEAEEPSFSWKVEETEAGVKDEEEGGKVEEPKVVTLKLFKRASIVKSQASEEDPEYVLPERPKLLEQEQDHPFKKAWQLQKSRSEEDPTAYSLKEVKSQPETSKSRSTVSQEPRIKHQTSSGTDDISESHDDDKDADATK